METMFTIFNHYIIEIMPEINKFYSKIINVKLPKVIEDLLNNNNNSNFRSYDYFKDNSDELLSIKSICFNIQNVLYIAKLVKQKSELFKEDVLMVKSAEK